MLLLPDPFHGMGAWQKTKSLRSWETPKAWTRGRRESPKSKQRKESVAGQCRMRCGVLGPVSAGAAGKILNSVNPEKIRA